jgi:hypothetical protein
MEKEAENETDYTGYNRIIIYNRLLHGTVAGGEAIDPTRNSNAGK